MKKMYHSQKFYLQICIVLFLLLILIITPITILLTKQFSKYVDKEIIRFTQENTYQAKERVNYTLDQLKYLSFSIYTDQRIQRYLSLNSKDPSVNRDVQVALSNYLINEPFVDSVYLINVKNGTMYNSKQGTMLINDFTDKELLSKLENESDILEYFKYEVNGKSLLGLIVSTTLDYEGYLISFLDVSKLSEFLLQTNHELDINVMVVNNRDELILGGPEEYYYSVKNDLLNSSIQNERGFLLSDGNGERMLTNYATLPTYEFKIFTLTNSASWNEDISSYRKNIIVLMLCLTAILFCVILVSAYRTYRPFKQLAEYLKGKFENRLVESKTISDYQLISHSIELLENNMNRMESTNNEYKEIVKSEYMRQWILQERYNESLLNQIKKEFSFMPLEYTYLVVIRIDSYQSFVEDYHFSSRKTIKYSIGKIVEESFLAKINLEQIDFGGDHIVLLINMNSKLDDMHINLLLDSKMNIKKLLKINVTISISNLINMNEGLRNIYNKMYEVSNVNFITGEERIYQEDDYGRYHNILHSDLIDHSMEKLIKIVSFGYEEQMKQAVNEIIDQLRKLPYNECKFHLSALIYQLFRKHNHFTSLKGFQGIQLQLGKFKTIDAAHRWLESELIGVIRNRNKRDNSDRKNEIANEIKDYIQVHLHNPLLSIDMLADSLSFSASYTRQVFKEVHNETINDYIIKKRLEEVLELLRTKDWNINSIAEYCGFQTKSNFYTLFKKVVGMTPSQYRKKYKIS